LQEFCILFARGDYRHLRLLFPESFLVHRLQRQTYHSNSNNIRSKRDKIKSDITCPTREAFFFLNVQNRNGSFWRNALHFTRGVSIEHKIANDQYTNWTEPTQHPTQFYHRSALSK